MSDSQIPNHKPRHWFVDVLIALFCGGGIVVWFSFFANQRHTAESPISKNTLQSASSNAPAASPVAMATLVLATPAVKLYEAKDETPDQNDVPVVSEKALEDALVDLASHGKSIEKMRPDFDAKSPKLLNLIAWHWATCKNLSHLNARMAVQLSQKVVAAVPDNPSYQDTLAAAYARTGNFVAAIETQEKAIDLAHANPSLVSHYEWRLQQMQQHLAAYRQRSCWSEDFDNPPRPSE